MAQATAPILDSTRSKADIRDAGRHVRCYPDSRHCAAPSAVPKPDPCGAANSTHSMIAPARTSRRRLPQVEPWAAGHEPNRWLARLTQYGRPSAGRGAVRCCHWQIPSRLLERWSFEPAAIGIRPSRRNSMVTAMPSRRCTSPRASFPGHCTQRTEPCSHPRSAPGAPTIQ